MFVDLGNRTMEYFDSFGLKPNRLVQRTIESIVEAIWTFYPEKDIGNVITYTKKQKQTGGLECGVYVVWFTVEKLKGASMKEISRASVNDATCRRLRNVYWNLLDVDTSAFEYT